MGLRHSTCLDPSVIQQEWLDSINNTNRLSNQHDQDYEDDDDNDEDDDEDVATLSSCSENDDEETDNTRVTTQTEDDLNWLLTAGRQYVQQQDQNDDNNDSTDPSIRPTSNIISTLPKSPFSPL
ncbi:unnamed protein product [Ambrosiozyma monospora]|uniref:Unnamed protein product n=1 Tax=Ambrosiozyma monospora TaxID=43982 RepID=A0A9W6YZ97_AMBMO|nr:unnamed protein product [Ambrosiozyma monospora]